MSEDVGLDDFVEGLDYPVFVVTAASGEERDGCLVGFATQASIDPPRLLVCLSKENRTTRIAQDAEVLAVHALGADEQLKLPAGILPRAEVGLHERRLAGVAVDFQGRRKANDRRGFAAEGHFPADRIEGCQTVMRPVPAATFIWTRPLASVCAVYGLFVT